jgi:uncharacterized protein
MGREFFRRLMPSQQWVQKHRALRGVEHLLHQPSLWHLNRHSASRGIACGMFWTFIPVPGQTLLACLTAIRVRGNVALAVITPWIAQIIFFPFYYLSYRIGLLILRQPPTQGFFDHFHISLQWFWTHRGPLMPFFVGSLPVAAGLGAASYFGVQGLWRWMVVRKIRRRNQRIAICLAASAPLSEVELQRGSLHPPRAATPLKDRTITNG